MTPNRLALKWFALAISLSGTSVLLSTVINDMLHNRRPDFFATGTWPFTMLALALMTAGFMMLVRVAKAK
jgi:hypothetical protein